VLLAWPCSTPLCPNLLSPGVVAVGAHSCWQAVRSFLLLCFACLPSIHTTCYWYCWYCCCTSEQLVSPYDKLRLAILLAEGCRRLQREGQGTLLQTLGRLFWVCVDAVVCMSVHHSSAAAVCWLGVGPSWCVLVQRMHVVLNTMQGGVFLLLLSVPYHRCLVHVRGGREPYRGYTDAGGLGVVFAFPAS
jgi:hypothetical protein